MPLRLVVAGRNLEVGDMLTEGVWKGRSVIGTQDGFTHLSGDGLISAQGQRLLWEVERLTVDEVIRDLVRIHCSPARLS